MTHQQLNFTTKNQGDGSIGCSINKKVIEYTGVMKCREQQERKAKRVYII